MKSLHRQITYSLILMSLLVLGRASAASEPDNYDSSVNSRDDWELTILPYLWMIGINGDVTVKGSRAKVDIDFSDVWKNLDLGGELHVEIRKGRYGLFIDPTYLKLSNGKNIPLNNGLELDKVTVKEWLVEFGGFYRFGTWNTGGNYNENKKRGQPFLSADALAGGRYINMDVELDLKDTSTGTPTGVDGNKDWLDLFIGGRLNFNLTENIPFILRSDIGGFGFGFSSDFAWNLVGHIGYELPWYRITPVLGYRLLYIDYADGSGSNRFAYNTWTHGPIIGIAFRF